MAAALVAVQLSGTESGWQDAATDAGCGCPPHVTLPVAPGTAALPLAVMQVGDQVDRYCGGGAWAN